jgi:hypothetical protein
MADESNKAPITDADKEAAEREARLSVWVGVDASVKHGSTATALVIRQWR